MSFYAGPSAMRTRQVSSDVFVVVWSAFWIWVGMQVMGLVRHVADPLRGLVDSSKDINTQMGTAADQVGGVPGFGERLRKPFDALAGNLTDLVGVAKDQIAAIEQLSNVVGVVVALIPIAMLIAIWLPLRLRFHRTNSAARRFLDSPADLDLFALRAMSNQPLHTLGRVSEDPVGAWRQGDRAIIYQLAEMELRRSGLKMPKALVERREVVEPSPPANDG